MYRTSNTTTIVVVLALIKVNTVFITIRFLFLNHLEVLRSLNCTGEVILGLVDFILTRTPDFSNRNPFLSAKKMLTPFPFIFYFCLLLVVHEQKHEVGESSHSHDAVQSADVQQRELPVDQMRCQVLIRRILSSQSQYACIPGRGEQFDLNSKKQNYFLFYFVVNLIGFPCCYLRSTIIGNHEIIKKKPQIRCFFYFIR